MPCAPVVNIGYQHGHQRCVVHKSRGRTHREHQLAEEGLVRFGTAEQRSAAADAAGLEIGGLGNQEIGEEEACDEQCWCLNWKLIDVKQKSKQALRFCSAKVLQKNDFASAGKMEEDRRRSQ